MIDTAITYTSPLKRELRRLGATGSGLHAMVTSIEDQLPTPLVKNLRFVITIRNKVLHGDTSFDLTPDQYAVACQRALDSLAQLKATPNQADSTNAGPAKLTELLVRLAVALLATLASVGVYLLTSNHFPINTLESWGVPLLTLGLLSTHAQASNIRHRLLSRGDALRTSTAAGWLTTTLAGSGVLAYLFPPSGELLPTLVALLTVSLLVHVLLGVNPHVEEARVSL